MKVVDIIEKRGTTITVILYTEKDKNFLKSIILCFCTNYCFSINSKALELVDDLPLDELIIVYINHEGFTITSES